MEAKSSRGWFGEEGWRGVDGQEHHVAYIQVHRGACCVGIFQRSHRDAGREVNHFSSL